MVNRKVNTSMDGVLLTDELYAYRCRGGVCVELLEANMMAQAIVDRCSKAVEDLVDQHKATDIVLDLQHVQWMCSLMLGKLVALAKQVRSNDGRLLLAGLSSQLEGVIKGAGLTEMLPMFADVNAALGGAAAPVALDRPR